jgi:phage shock protein A
MADKLPKLAELLEQVRAGAADVAQSRERVQESMTVLARAQAKLGQQAETARRFGREDLAQAALARQEATRSQLAGLARQHDQLLAEEARLQARHAAAARALQAKIDALRWLSEGTGRPGRRGRFPGIVDAGSSVQEDPLMRGGACHHRGDGAAGR